MRTGSFPGVKRPGRGVGHPFPSSAEVKERVELCLYFFSGPSWSVRGWLLPLPWSWRRRVAVRLSCVYAKLPGVTQQQTVIFTCSSVTTSASVLIRSAGNLSKRNTGLSAGASTLLRLMPCCSQCTDCSYSLFLKYPNCNATWRAFRAHVGRPGFVLLIPPMFM